MISRFVLCYIQERKNEPVPPDTAQHLKKRKRDIEKESRLETKTNRKRLKTNDDEDKGKEKMLERIRNDPIDREKDKLLEEKVDARAPGEEESTEIGILHLPVEVQQYIFSFLPIRTVVRLNVVCKQWLSLTSDMLFWRHMFTVRFGCPAFLMMNWKDRYVAKFVATKKKKNTIDQFKTLGA